MSPTVPDLPASAASPASGLFSARYSDGRSAIAHEARVALMSTGLVITARDIPGRVVWAYSRLRSARPLTAGGEVLVTNADDEAASLFVTSPAFAAALARLAPDLTRSGRFRRRAAPWVLAAAVLALIAAGLALLDLSPAHGIARLMPDRVRAALGRQAIDSMARGRRTCAEPAGRAALDRLAARLSTAAAGKHFRIVVVDWKLMNAYATPGEQIVVTSGLIAKADSPDELAGVLSHEMGHGIAMHPETSIVRSIGLVTAAGLVFGTGSLTNIGIQLAELRYTREAEHEADMLGLGILKSAGISTKGLIDFFTRVEKIESTGSLKGFDILRSHPATAERKRLVAEQAAYPATPSLSAEDWSALKAICPAVAPALTNAPK